MKNINFGQLKKIGLLFSCLIIALMIAGYYLPQTSLPLAEKLEKLMPLLSMFKTIMILCVMILIPISFFSPSTLDSLGKNVFKFPQDETTSRLLGRTFCSIWLLFIFFGLIGLIETRVFTVATTLKNTNETTIGTAKTVSWFAMRLPFTSSTQYKQEAISSTDKKYLLVKGTLLSPDFSDIMFIGAMLQILLLIFFRKLEVKQNQSMPE
ncbi:MAG: hypothetical protein GX410_00605 [Elusimicrobia bacterium]|nr:hypothetical protein [Elusimicrobiota bacterium]